MKGEFKSIRDVVARAGVDEALRARLLANPRETLGEALGRDFASAFEITVLVEKPHHMYLILPDAPRPEGELADEELDTVAGGQETWEFRCTHGMFC